MFPVIERTYRRQNGMEYVSLGRDHGRYQARYDDDITVEWHSDPDCESAAGKERFTAEYAHGMSGPGYATWTPGLAAQVLAGTVEWGGQLPFCKRCIMHEDVPSADARAGVSMSAAFIPCDAVVLARQIGTMNILATSGGRIYRRETGITLPVRYGYSVTVDLAAGDTYTVRRVFTRAGQVSIKAELEGVYCEDVGEQVYRAGCFRDRWPQ
jgi:glycine/D-amino acid oxidase-like deaminating enzyme